MALFVRGEDPLSGAFAIANVTMSIAEARAHIEAIERAIASTEPK